MSGEAFIVLLPPGLLVLSAMMEREQSRAEQIECEWRVRKVSGSGEMKAEELAARGQTVGE